MVVRKPSHEKWWLDFQGILLAKFNWGLPKVIIKKGSSPSTNHDILFVTVVTVGTFFFQGGMIRGLGCWVGVKEQPKRWMDCQVFFFNLQIFDPIPGCLLIPSNKKVYIYICMENMNIYIYVHDI